MSIPKIEVIPVCKEALEYVSKVIRSHVKPTNVSLKVQVDKLICSANGYEPMSIDGVYRMEDIKADIYRFGLYNSAAVFTPDHEPNTVIISLY